MVQYEIFMKIRDIVTVLSDLKHRFTFMDSKDGLFTSTDSYNEEVTYKLCKDFYNENVFKYAVQNPNTVRIFDTIVASDTIIYYPNSTTLNNGTIYHKDVGDYINSGLEVVPESIALKLLGHVPDVYEFEELYFQALISTNKPDYVVDWHMLSYFINDLIREKFTFYSLYWCSTAVPSYIDVTRVRQLHYMIKDYIK